jgi:hypothetical protein
MLNDSVRVFQKIVEKRFGRRSSSTKATGRHHTIITGTERADIAFLARLLANLDLDTGDRKYRKDTTSDGEPGPINDIRPADRTYVAQSAWFGDEIDKLVTNPSIVIDYAIISLGVRAPDIDGATAAGGRRHAEYLPDAENGVNEDPSIRMGPRESGDRPEKESIIARQFHKLLLGLSKTDAEIILLHHPRLTRGPHYLYAKLLPLIGSYVSPQRFCAIFARTVQSRLVHNTAAEHESSA